MKKLILVIITALCSFVSFGQHGRISLVAGGDGGGSFSGDGMLATDSAVALNNAGGICTDSAGNIYIYDQDNFRIRRVDAVTGIITTVAGNGAFRHAGDGGPATAASFSSNGSSCNVVTDLAGNIYFCDSSRYIRKVNITTGIISTVVGNGSTSYSGDGGPATAAGISITNAIFVDNRGNIYAGDGPRIRKVDATTGIITTIAGTGSYGYSGDGGPATAATFREVAYLTGDSSGNIYFTDPRDHRVRKITSAGIITTIAGNGIQFTDGDGGPASAATIDAPECIGINGRGDIYFSGAIYNVRKIDAATGIINKVAGCTRWCGSAGMGYSASGAYTDTTVFNTRYMHVDRHGNIFYTDALWVYKIDSPEAMITIIRPSDSFSTLACTLPTTRHFGVFGTIRGIPSATDSVDIIFTSGEFSLTPDRTYRIPYRSASAGYVFGDTFSNIGSYTYTVPGIYSPVIYIRALGYATVIRLSQDTVGSTCSTGISRIIIDSARNEVTSGFCSTPRDITHHIWGHVMGTPLPGDSIHVVLDKDDNALPFVHHVVACSLSGSTYYFADTISHRYSLGDHRQHIRSVTSSGRYYVDTYLPDAVDSCSRGAVSLTFFDSTSLSTYCSLPLTNRFYFGGNINDSAMLDTPYMLSINYGDGTIYYPPISVTRRSEEITIAPRYFTHTYTMSGMFAPTATLRAGSFSRTVSLTPFIAGTSCSPVSGVFYIDSNADCINQLSETKLGYWPLAIVNNGLHDTMYVWCDDTGHYSANVVNGYSYTIFADPSIAFGGTASRALVTSCPSSGTYTFTSSGGSVIRDFGFSCTTPPSVDMYPAGMSGPYFPGDTNNIVITASNPYGYFCDTLSASVTLVLDTILDYIGMRSGPAPASISGNTLVWHFSNPYSLFEFDAVVKARCHTTATTRDTVRNLVSVTPCRITDPDTTNNSNYWPEIVRNSHDPNDKIVSPKGYGPGGFIRNGTRLTYLIRFQNTGSAPARNITIVDTLPATLDVSTLQILSYSFPFNIYSLPGNVVKFRFNDIYLPDSLSDPAGSNGYVAFNIMPFDSLARGTTISNNASIYFDYNSPIVTAATINTIEDSLYGITGPSTVCIGSSITLGSWGFTGIWSNTTGNTRISGPVVTGVTAGLDTIKFVSTGGQVKYAIITVVAPPVAALLSGRDSVCIAQQITLRSSATTGVWSSGNTAIATVSPTGVVTGVSAGTTQISYSITNACGSVASAYALRVVNSSTCPDETAVTGTPTPTPELRVYPNPNNGTLSVDLPAGTGDIQLTITTIQGKVLLTEQYPANQTRTQLTIKEKGMFFVKVMRNGITYRVKMIAY